MGRVFLGVGPDERRVAVKLMHESFVQDPEFRSRFRREVAAARRVSGPFTASVVDADPDADLPWLATEFVDGQALDVAIDRGGPMSQENVLTLAKGLAEALDAVHRAGVVHRDLKPSNVLLGPDGPKLIDFGIARAVDGTRVTLTGSAVGTPGFMSPEQVRGEEPDPAGDVFALGAVIFYAATGRGPYGTGSAHALLYRVVNGHPDLRALPPGPLRDIVAACLSKEPGRRPGARDIANRGEQPTVAVPTAVIPPEAAETESVAAPVTTPVGRAAGTAAVPSSGLRTIVPRTRRSRVMAGVVAVALAGASGAALWNGFGGGGGGGAADPSTVRYGVEQDPQSYNNTTLDTAPRNATITNLLQRGFSRLTPNGTVEEDREFGTVEKISDSPLRVLYTIDERAVWSDGEPITCDDAVLTWMAASGRFTGSGDVGFDPDSTAGYELQEQPACATGEKQFTVTYTRPYADWRALYGQSSILPSHVLLEEAGLDRSIPEIAAAADDGEIDDMARFWTEGWDLDARKLDRSLLPSSGPYVLGAWNVGEFLNLEANTRWWGTPPAAQRIQIRIASGEQLPAMLGRGELDVISPVSDDIPQLKADLAPYGDVAVRTASTTLAERVVMNADGVMADRRVRQALARCVPRQRIVDDLIKPAQEDAEVLATRLVVPLQPGYADVARLGNDRRYGEVDVAGAKSLLAAAGKPSVTVRVGYSNPPGGGATVERRARIVELMRESCAPAGITIEDVSSGDFLRDAADPGKRAWEVALLAWAIEPGAQTADDLYHSPDLEHGFYNFGSYSNEQVDELLGRYATELDEGARAGLLRQIETVLWDDMPDLPLSLLPDVVATGKGVTGVELNATEAGLTWNAEKWKPA